jgi:hypothetical protein
LYSKDNITLGEERGNTFIMLLKERRKGDCGNAINSEYFDNSGGSYTGRPSESECLWKKMIGKPYSGKPNVRFDEGELEIEHSATTPALYSTELGKHRCASVKKYLKYLFSDIHKNDRKNSDSEVKNKSWRYYLNLILLNNNL